MDKHKHKEVLNPIGAKHVVTAKDISALSDQAHSLEDGALGFETILQVVANSSIGMVSYWDQQLRCRFANAQYLDWYGKTKDGMQGIRLQDLQSKELSASNEPYIRAVLAGKEQSFERLLFKPGGNPGWVWVRYIPHAANDEVIGFVALLLDITERKNAEAALQASEARLVEAQSVANIGSWETDLASLNVIWSEQTYKIFNLDPRTFQASHPSFLEFVHPQDRADVDAAFLKSFEDTKTNSIEHRIVSAAGVTKHVQERWRIERDSQGMPVRAVGTCQDITEKRETQLAQKQIADRLALAARAGGVGIWDWDIVSNISVWDDAMYALYGTTETEYGGVYEAWSATVHPDDQTRCNAEIQLAVSGEKDYDTEFRVVWPNGTIRDIRAIGIVQRDVNGLAVRMVGTNWDITTQKHHEALLLSSVREKNALLKEVHHRVKNNLQVITSLLRLESGRSAVADTKEVLSYMRGRIRAMAQLHESLYRSGTFASVNLGEYLSQVATQAFKAQDQNHGSVILKLKMDSVQVGMDQATSAGLLLNELISNCLKHGFPEGLSGEVGVQLQPALAQNDAPDDRWCLSVSDTGVGLLPDFENKRKASLGLQLVEDLSSQLGGNLVNESEPGRGTRFSVVFSVEEPVALDIQT